MSSLALMRWLEGAPDRYDAGMRLLTLGRAARAQDLVAGRAARPGADVLEIGCGTGALTERLVRRGARVVALDQDPEMLERARARLEGRGARFLECTASEIDARPPASCDAVVASFVLSEMSPGERRYVLDAARACLRPGGALVVADEVRPPPGPARWLHALLRAPQALLGWLLAGATSRPIPDLGAELRLAGFALRWERRFLLGGLGVFEAAPATAASGSSDA